MPNTNYIAGDKTYSIPDEEKQDFLKDNPNAKEVNLYEANGKKYGIPDKDTLEFQKDFPDAKLLQEQHRHQKDNAIPSFNPIENVTNAVKDKIKPPRDIYSNLTPSDNGNMPFVSTVKGTEQEQQKSEQELANKIDKGNLNILTPEEQKQHNFNQTAKSVWTTLLTDPNAKDENTREDFYKLYEKDFDKDQIEKLKKVGDAAANLQAGYEQVRQQAHDNPNPENYSLLGQYQAAAGDMETAHKTFTYLMNTYPDRSEGYVGNAYLAYKHGDINGAIGFTNQSLKANPDDVNALNERAKYETIKGNPQNAAIDADKAVKNAKYGTDESVSAYQTRANVYKALGKKDLAAQDEATANAMAITIKGKPKKDLENKFRGEYEADLKQRRAEGITPEEDKGTEYESLDTFIPFRQKNIQENISEEENIKKAPLSSVVGGLFNDPVTHDQSILGGVVSQVAQGTGQIAGGIQEATDGNVIKGALKAGLGGAHVAFGLAGATPAGAEFNAVAAAGEQVAPNLTKYLMNPFTSTFDPKTETGRNVAELGDILTNLLVMRRLGQGTEGFNEGLKTDKTTEQPLQKTDQSPVLNITPDQSVESKLNDYKETNKKFLDNLKKSNLDQYNSTIASAKARFENEVKPKVTSEELKLKGVQDKIVNKQQFTPSDVETLSTFVESLSPDEIKQAAKNLPENPVEKIEENKPEQVEETKVEKPEKNELDKATSDLTRLQSRLGKAAENKKAGIQKQIDAKNKQIEELRKPVEEKPVELTKTVNQTETLEKPVEENIPTVTPEVSEDGTINNRDNKGIEDALDKGEKKDNNYFGENAKESFENKYKIKVEDIDKEIEKQVKSAADPEAYRKHVGAKQLIQDAIKEFAFQGGKWNYEESRKADFMYADYVKTKLEGDLPKKLPAKKDLYDITDLKGELNIKPIDSAPIKSKSIDESLKNIVATDELRPVMEGIYHDAENKVKVATDAYALVVVPDKSIKTTKIVNPKTGQQIEGKYPNYKSVIPNNFRVISIENPAELLNKLEGLERANKFSTGGKEGIYGQIKYGDKEIYFNPSTVKRVIQSLQANGAKSIDLELPETPNKAIVFRDRKNPELMGLAMPKMYEGDDPFSNVLNQEANAEPNALRRAIQKAQEPSWGEEYYRKNIEEAKIEGKKGGLDADYYQPKFDAAKKEREANLAELQKKLSDIESGKNKPTIKEPIEKGVVKRNPKLPKDQYIQGSDTDIKFSADKTVKGKNVLAPPSEPHYIGNKDNPKNFLAGAKRSRLVRPQPEGETEPEKLIQGETAHEGTPVANWRGEAIQGDGRLTRFKNLTDEQKENYYKEVTKYAKTLGFTPEQIENAKAKGWMLQRFVNAGHDEAANLSQKDERDLLTHDAADLAADKIKTLTPDQVDNFAHLFDGRPLEDILQNDGVQILHALNEAGVISDLTTERMKIGNAINPTFIPHLTDVFRSVITGDIGNNEIPVRDYYNNAPDIIKHSLDRIIPEILKLPADKRPNEYLQKALVVLGNKGDVPTRDFVENLQNASDLDKAFIPFVLDPVSKHTIPDLIRDYKLQLQGLDYEGQKPMTMSDAIGHLFLENDNNPLNEKERETQDVERGTSVQPNQQGTSGKETGTGTNEDNRTAGQKIADKVFGSLPVMEKISDLPDNLPIIQNSVLGNLITGVRGVYRRLAKLDNRDASHAVSYFHNERTGTDKAMNLYSVQSLEQLNDADPETNLYENKYKVYKHFDELERARNLGLPEPDFKADNNAQQILYDFTNAIKERTDRLVDELKDVQGLPDSYLDLVKESTKGFLHRMLGEHYVPMDIAKERESREAEIQAYKEGRKDLKDIGGVRGLFQQTMAEEQIKPKYKGFLGNDNSDIFEPRKTLEAVDKKTGEKSIVEFQEGGKVVKWKDGKPTPIGDYKDLSSIRKENSFTDEKGNEYSLNDGLVSDIKKETGKNYIEHPVLSAIEGLRSLSKIHSTVKFFQSIKNAPEVSQFMKVLNKEQLDVIQNIKSASLKENSTEGLQTLIDEHNASISKPSAKKPIQVMNPKRVIEYADTDTPNDLTNKLLTANNMPENFLNEFQAAKGIIKHPIFDDTYFKRNALESIQNSLMDDKPKNSELIRGYLNWVYLGIEGTGHALNLATNTAINTAAEIVGGNFKGLGDSFTEAEKAIREQNDTHKYLQSHGVSNFFNVNPDYTEAVVNILKQNIADNPEKNKPLNEAIANMASDYKEGFKDLKNIGSKVNRSLIWWLNDMNAYSTILKEASNQGLDVKNIDFNNPEHTTKLDNAIKVSAQNYNSYHIASEELVGGKVGRLIADGLRNRGVFIFTNYLVGNVKVLAGQVTQIGQGVSEIGNTIKGESADPENIRRANTAIDRIAVGAAMLYGIQQFENWRNKDKSDVYHEENRPGLLRIPYEVERFSKGQINIGELATKIIHPTPLLMNFPNWVQNHNGLGGVNDPNGNIFSSDGWNYLMNGASIAKVNQQTTGEKIWDFVKPRLGLEYDVKMTPYKHGLVTQLRNFNEFIDPEMKAITKSLQQYHKKLNSGQPIETKDKIDEVGFNNFLSKAYYTSGNVLDKWDEYAHERLAELQKSNLPERGHYIEFYNNLIPKIEEIKNTNKKEFEDYMRDKNIKSEVREGEVLKQIGESVNKILNQEP